MKFAIGGFATTVFALLATATSPLAAASPDDDFLAALTRNGLSFPAQAGPSLLTAGHSVCSKLGKGDTYKEVTVYIEKAFGGNKGLSGGFVSAATSTLCPEFA
ncbi:DUF732 domain-containing protein [Mycobacterium sp. NPDC048908]|uniref:DUF732 domain-containing protein n=1 Tax=Mycobacterium sp. NPDC048908 TaxID=3364292 RepID=UPI00371E06E1